MKRYVILYVATMLVMLPLDLIFLGLVAKSFFQSQVGDMLGDLRPVPAVLFYLLYIVGIMVFVNGSPGATPSSTVVYGALFGLFCYATFELTSMALLKHWTWPVVTLDISWGMIVTAAGASLGLLLANWIQTRI